MSRTLLHVEGWFSGAVVGGLGAMQWGLADWRWWIVMVGWATVSSALHAAALTTGERG